MPEAVVMVAVVFPPVAFAFNVWLAPMANAVVSADTSNVALLAMAMLVEVEGIVPEPFNASVPALIVVSPL